MRYITTVEDKEYTIEILDDQSVLLNGQPVDVDLQSVGDQPIYSLLVEGQSYEIHVYPSEDGLIQVVLHGNYYPVQVEDERQRKLQASLGKAGLQSGEVQVKAPMPGLVVTVPVSEGQEVQKGEVLVILESMKMQNEIKSPRAGKVNRIRIKPGDSVEQKQPLLSVG